MKENSRNWNHWWCFTRLLVSPRISHGGAFIRSKKRIWHKKCCAQLKEALSFGKILYYIIHIYILHLNVIYVTRFSFGLLLFGWLDFWNGITWFNIDHFTYLCSLSVFHVFAWCAGFAYLWPTPACLFGFYSSCPSNHWVWNLHVWVKWLLFSAGTPSLQTGPTGDRTLNNGQGKHHQKNEYMHSRCDQNSLHPDSL